MCRWICLGRFARTWVRLHSQRPCGNVVRAACASVVVSWFVFPPAARKTRVQFPAAEFQRTLRKRERWAEAPIKIARMTLTIKLDRNWSSFQLANSAPPLSVTDGAIAPSARLAGTAHATNALTCVCEKRVVHGQQGVPGKRRTQRRATQRRTARKSKPPKAGHVSAPHAPTTRAQALYIVCGTMLTPTFPRTAACGAHTGKSCCATRSGEGRSGRDLSDPNRESWH